MRPQRPAQARHRAHQEQDGRPRRAARHRALPRRAVAEGRRSASPTTSSTNAPRTQNVEIGRGDFVHRAHRPDGALPRGEGMGRLCRRRRAGRQIRELLLVARRSRSRRSASDTWGVEVRPNETTEVNQPWHWVVIPAMGLTMGEMFYVKELAEDCDEGRRLRVLLLRAAADHHRRHRLADQSAGDQIISIRRS